MIFKLDTQRLAAGAGAGLQALFTPAPDPREALLAALQARRWPHRPRGFAYRGGADLLLQHGQFYAGRRTPDRYAAHRGPGGCCYRTAATAALAMPGLRYCEGYYVIGRAAIAHAWCLDARGRVVELSPHGEHADKHWGYWGCVFSPQLALDYMASIGAHSASLLDSAADGHDVTLPPGLTSAIDDRDDWPILRVPYDPERRTIPESRWTVACADSAADMAVCGQKDAESAMTDAHHPIARLATGSTPHWQRTATTGTAG